MVFAGEQQPLGEEYLDAEDLETEFYRGLKQDIDQILLKAWDGDSQNAVSQDELRRFQEIMRYKQGQELFVHLMNQFRVRRTFKIVNMKAFFQLGDLLQIVLDKNYEWYEGTVADQYEMEQRLKETDEQKWKEFQQSQKTIAQRGIQPVVGGDTKDGSWDTSIPINCQVLAATFYMTVDEPYQPTKKIYLFELIKDKKIWSNLNFWERTISQYI